MGLIVLKYSNSFDESEWLEILRDFIDSLKSDSLKEMKFERRMKVFYLTNFKENEKKAKKTLNFINYFWKQWKSF